MPSTQLCGCSLCTRDEGHHHFQGCRTVICPRRVCEDKPCSLRPLAFGAHNHTHAVIMLISLSSSPIPLSTASVALKSPGFCCFVHLLYSPGSICTAPCNGNGLLFSETVISVVFNSDTTNCCCPIQHSHYQCFPTSVENKGKQLPLAFLCLGLSSRHKWRWLMHIPVPMDVFVVREILGNQSPMWWY